MDVPDFLDNEVLSNIGFWFLTVGAEFALMIGFKLAEQWGNGGVGWVTKILSLALVPVAAYFITMYHTR